MEPWNAPVARLFGDLWARLYQSGLDSDKAYADRQRKTSRKLQKLFGQVEAALNLDGETAVAQIKALRQPIERELSWLDDEDLTQRGKELLLFAEMFPHSKMMTREDRFNIQNQIVKYIEELGSYWR